MSLRLPRPAVSRLGVKLFVVILSVNVAISALVFLGISRSLDRGFIEYLDTTQANRAETLAEGLGEEWASRGGDWQWLRASPSAWHRLVRMTTLTTFLGLAPMIFETSRQARFIIPMAISLGFGMLFATLILLLLVPCLYLMLEGLRERLGGRSVTPLEARS